MVDLSRRNFRLDLPKSSPRAHMPLGSNRREEGVADEVG
jgi:hypothetical protein